jgi:hypothetical protein
MYFSLDPNTDHESPADTFSGNMYQPSYTHTNMKALPANGNFYVEQGNPLKPTNILDEK